MKKKVVIIFSILIIFTLLLNIKSCISFVTNINIYLSRSPKNLVSKNGYLKTEGNKLKNQIDKDIVLKGVSSHGIQWFDRMINYKTLKHLRDEWGINVFRIAMYTLEDGYIQNPKIKNKVMKIIDEAIELNLYIIVDWHILSDGNPNIYIKQSKEFFAEISEKYKNKPNVIYEICNEPNGPVTWDNDIKPYAEEVIQIIRDNSPKSLIIVGTPHWSQDVDKAADNPLEFPNILYASHFYAGDHGKELQEKIDYALNKGLPVFVSEWGISKQNGNDGIFIEETDNWMKFLDKRNISWINWSFSDKHESSAILSVYSSTENFNIDRNLTKAGEYIKKIIDTRK